MCVYLQAWKRSYFATLPQFLNLTTSKTKGFCETSSILELDTIQNEAIQRDVLNFWLWQHQKRSNSARLPQIWKAECRALHLCKVLRLPRKSNARLYEVLRLSGKIIFPKLKIWCSKMQPLSGNQRPHLLISLMNMSLVLRLPRKMHLCRSSSKCPMPAIVFGNATKPSASRFAHFWQGAQPPALATQNDIWTSKRPKVFKTRQFFTLDFEMCFAPQPRALFRHLNFQKCSEAEVSCTCWLGNVLRATTVCNFSSLIWPAGSAPAAFASLLFDPPEPQITGKWKTHCFAHLDLLSSETFSFWSSFFSSLTLPISTFHLSILSKVWLLNFFRWYQ